MQNSRYFFSLVLLPAILLLLANSTNAGIKRLSSTAGSTVVWSTSSNWTPMGAPTITDDVIFDYANENGTKTILVGLNVANTTANSLTFGGSTTNGAFGAFELRANSSNSTARTLTLGTVGQAGAGSITVDSSVIGTQSVGTNSALFGTLTLTLGSGVSGFTVTNNSVTQTLDLEAKLAQGVTAGSTLMINSAGGMVILGGANTYAGATTVNGGTVLINGDQTAATGRVTVNNSGSTLGGTGTIGGAVTVNGGTAITGATNGTAGALTLHNGLTLTGASGSLATYLVDLTSTSSDKLAITGNLNLSTMFDQIKFQGSSGAASYILATYTGTLSGTFDTVTGLPSGYSLIYNAGEIDLDMTPVPEPSTWLAGALAVSVLGWSQRKRLRKKAEILRS